MKNWVAEGIASDVNDSNVHVTFVHERNMQFKSEIWDYSFFVKSQMKTHITMVHEEKIPFKCDICDYSFSPESHENTFKCEICNYCCFLTKQMNQQGLHKRLSFNEISSVYLGARIDLRHLSTLGVVHK